MTVNGPAATIKQAVVTFKVQALGTTHSHCGVCLLTGMCKEAGRRPASLQGTRWKVLIKKGRHSPTFKQRPDNLHSPVALTTITTAHRTTKYTRDAMSSGYGVNGGQFLCRSIGPSRDE